MSRGRLVTPNEILYAEAQLALGKDDVESARMMLSRCDESYRNVKAYRERCDVLTQLRKEGVIQRPDHDGLRAFLSRTLSEAEHSLVINKYAEALRANGFCKATLGSMTLSTLDVVLECLPELHAGHRTRLIQLASEQTSAWERVGHALGRAMNKCVHLTVEGKGFKAVFGDK